MFVPAPSTDRLPELTARYRGLGVLFISEDPHAGHLNAVINMSVLENRVVFDISLEVAQAQTLTVSSKLLQLARRVTGSAVQGQGTAAGPAVRETGK